MERADVKRSFDFVDLNKDQILAEWIALTEINAPSCKERERAEAVRNLLRSRGLDKVYYDSKGNLIAIRKGSGGAKPVVFDAHLDTVFPEGTDVTVKHTGDRLVQLGRQGLVGRGVRNPQGAGLLVDDVADLHEVAGVDDDWRLH